MKAGIGPHLEILEHFTMILELEWHGMPEAFSIRILGGLFVVELWRIPAGCISRN